jgi:MSHA biogenesis protein MshM
MYESHFGLRQRPFRSSPDGSSYYPATGHETALASVLQALRQGDSLALLTGEPGMGKTLLCHGLPDRLDVEVASAFLPHSHFSDRASLLQAILFDLSLPYELGDARREQELRLGLMDFLLGQYTAGRRTVLLVDEAQHLGADLLEEIRLLTNLEGGSGAALQVVFVAQPAFLETLRRPGLEGFAQRLAVRARLEPLGLHEAADYLLYHVRLAGGRPERVFSDEALEVLARGSRGIPRLLNQAAHQALILAHGIGAACVDAEAALEALAMLGLEDGAQAVADGEIGNDELAPVEELEDTKPNVAQSPSVAQPGTNGTHRPA